MEEKVLAENIRAYRRSLGMTQQELASRIYAAPQTISKWESGISEPDTEHICSLADVFGISIDNLIRSRYSEVKDGYIAIDGGGTKTDFVLFSADGEIIKHVALEGCNPNSGSLEKTCEVLGLGIDRLMEQGVRVRGGFAGIAGAGVGALKKEIGAFLGEKYPFMQFRVESDTHNVVCLSGGEEKCVAVISGTGSAVCCWDGREMHLVGAWGYLFDEAGSGFDMGRDAIRHCLAVEDGECEGGILYRDITAALGGGAHEKLGEVYSRGRDYIASFAPTVFACYTGGDKTAEKIVFRMADRICELIERAAERWDVGNLVVLAGGITYMRRILEPLFRERLKRNRRLLFVSAPPVLGAAIKCMRVFRVEHDYAKFEEKFIKSLERKGQRKGETK